MLFKPPFVVHCHGSPWKVIQDLWNHGLFVFVYKWFTQLVSIKHSTNMLNAQWENGAVSQLQGGQGGWEMKSSLALIPLRAATMSFTIQFLAQNLFLSTHLLNQTEYQAKQVALCPARNRWRAWVGWCFLLRSYLTTVLISHCQESQCRKTMLCIVT